MYIPAVYLLPILLYAPSLFAKPGSIVVPLQKAKRSGQNHRAAGSVERRLMAPDRYADVLSKYENGFIYGTFSVGYLNETVKFVIDTGSAFTWLQGNYIPSPEGVETNSTDEIIYGLGSVNFTIYEDFFYVTPTLEIQQQPFGVADPGGVNISFGAGVSGIAGIGPGDLNIPATYDSDESPCNPYNMTLLDSLFAQGLIESKTATLYVEPSSNSNATDGKLFFGEVGAEDLQGVGSFNELTAATDSPYVNYFAVTASNITMGNTTLASSFSCLVDSGTTLLYLPTNAFLTYAEMINAKIDEITGFYYIFANETENLQTIEFNFGNTTLSMIADAQVYSVASARQDFAPYYIEDAVYLIINDGGSLGGNIDCILGLAFQERFAVRYALPNTTTLSKGPGVVSMAETEFTSAIVNLVQP